MYRLMFSVVPNCSLISARSAVACPARAAFLAITSKGLPVAVHITGVCGGGVCGGALCCCEYVFFSSSQ